MAAISAIAAGYWDVTTTWSTGAVPTSADTVNLANYQVEIRTAAVASSLSDGGSTGSQLFCNSSAGSLNFGSVACTAASLLFAVQGFGGVFNIAAPATVSGGTLFRVDSGLGLTYTGGITQTGGTACNITGSGTFNLDSLISSAGYALNVTSGAAIIKSLTMSGSSKVLLAAASLYTESMSYASTCSWENINGGWWLHVGTPTTMPPSPGNHILLPDNPNVKPGYVYGLNGDITGTLASGGSVSPWNQKQFQ